MTDRRQDIDTFLAGAGWENANRSPLAGDASSRRYERLQQIGGDRAVLMDAPPEAGEDVRPFVHIAQYLQSIGLSAPEVLATDETQGFLLLEDLGDALFARVFETEPSLQAQLYLAATDVLLWLHSKPFPELTPLEAPLLAEMIGPVFDWYQLGILGLTDSSALATFQTAFREVLTHLTTGPAVMVLRDFHAENLLWLPDRSGIARVGLLDFQDAKSGHPAYDLVSLLQDARRDVPLDIEAQAIAHYIAKSGVDPESFGASYAVLGAQRNLRILGIFARLCLRDGKAHYVDLIPRVWEFVTRNLTHPALVDIAPLVLETLPSPTPERLQRLKDKCATLPTP
ncbi:MAG: phosphotransferase [Paracoccaceae bacterium]